MPCHAAMTDKALSISPGDTVENAIAALKKARVDLAPVVDAEGAAVGVIALKTILENLLPVSVTTNEGIQLDVRVGAAPGIAKRLKKIEPLTVNDLMDRKFAYVYPETPLWEGVNLLVRNGGAPVLVVEPKSGRVLGVMTAQSALDELARLKDSES